MKMFTPIGLLAVVLALPACSGRRDDHRMMMHEQTMSRVAQAESSAAEARSIAQQALAAAQTAQSQSDAALQTAQAADRAAKEASERADRIFRKSQRK